MASLVESKASYLATGCPGCIIQLRDSANHAGNKIKVIHTIELAEQIISLQSPEKKANW
jgi:glycolate oxidase iron-sulfur subunit